MDAYPQLILPVPLHRNRLRERGYNQALELGRPIAQRLAIPLSSRLVRRVRPTLPQSDMGSPAARRRNLTGAFQAVEPHAVVQHVAILDDVMTTGATVMELARLLRREGVRRVDVWCCARASR